MASCAEDDRANSSRAPTSGRRHRARFEQWPGEVGRAQRRRLSLLDECLGLGTRLLTRWPTEVEGVGLVVEETVVEVRLSMVTAVDLQPPIMHGKPRPPFAAFWDADEGRVTYFDAVASLPDALDAKAERDARIEAERRAAREAAQASLQPVTTGWSLTSAVAAVEAAHGRLQAHGGHLVVLLPAGSSRTAKEAAKALYAARR